MIKFDFDSKQHSPSIREIRERDVLSTDVLSRIAGLLKNAIHFEIRRDQALQRGLKRKKGDPEGLPMDPKFVESFKVTVRGDTLEVTSNWPTASALLEGRDKYRMTWLTQSKGVKVVPMAGPQNTTEFRRTPKATADAWIHPGFKKQDFLDRAFDRAMAEAAELVVRQLLAKMASKRYL